MNLEVAAHILAKGKRLTPDRFPQAGPETAEVWAGALGRRDFPPALWSEAVTVWATEMVGDRMCTPRDLSRAALVVRDRWEGDPERAAALDLIRVARANRNYARAGLEPIEAADLPQYAGKPPQALTERSRGQEAGPERMGVTGMFKRRSQQ